MIRPTTEAFNPRVTAVTVNWNQAADTLVCLASLERQEGVNPKLIVVDNGSTDGSVESIQERFPQVEVLVNPENLGFARGFNRGIHRAFETGADYVFIINNDAYLAPDALAILLKYPQADTGLLAPIIYYHSHPNTLWAAGSKVNPWNLEQTDSMRGKSDPGNWPETLEQDFITGCGILIPRHTFERVGAFDEDFRMYYEDADLCRSVREAGLRIFVIPQSKMWHKVALSSGGSNSPNERYWMAKSSVIFFRKHARGLQKPVVVFWRTGSAIRTTFRLIAKGKWDSIKAYWRGLRDGWKAHESHANPVIEP